MLQNGKLVYIKLDMAHLEINVLGISETRWSGEDDYKSDGFGIIHLGGDESQGGVATVIDKRTSNYAKRTGMRVTDCWW